MKIPMTVSSGDFLTSSKQRRRLRSPDNHIDSNCIRSPQSENRVLDCRKKVKFSTSEIRNTNGASAGLDEVKDSSVRSQRNEAVKFNAPKTSEFAFYKKLKEDAGRQSFCHSRQKEGNPKVKKVELDGRSIGYTRTGNSREDITSSIPNNTLTPVEFGSFLRPLGITSKNSDGWKEPTTGVMRSKQENSQGCSQTKNPEGNHPLHGGVFSRKRQKLRQYIAESSFSEFAKLSKGDDIISILLSRLFRNSNLDVGSEFKDSKPMEPDIVIKSKLLTFAETDIQLNEHETELFKHQGDSYSELKWTSPVINRSDERPFYSDFPTYHFDDLKDRHWKLSEDRNSYISWAYDESDIIFNEPHYKPTADFLEHTSMSFLKDGMTCGRFDNRDEKPILYTDSPTTSDNPYHWCSSKEIDFRLCRTPHFSTEGDLTFSSLLDEHGQSTPNHLKEHEKISREPITPFLGWYVDSTMDEGKLFLSYSRTESPQFFTSFDDEPQPRPASAFDQYRLPSSQPVHQRDFTSLQNSCLLEYRPRNVAKSVLEGKYSAERDANHTSLALSCPMDIVELGNGFNNQSLLIQDSSSLTPQIPHCFRLLISNNNQQYQGREIPPLPSLCNFDSRNCCLPLLDLQSPGGARLSVYDSPPLITRKENMFLLPAVEDDYDRVQSEGDRLLLVGDDMLKLHSSSSSFLRISLESNSASSYGSGWH